MKIIVTGSCGFIGFHLCKSLLDDDHEILGIDNINDYYDTSLKYARLAKLLDFENFVFNKVDLEDHTALSELFREYQPERVIHLAAQAGVR